MSRSAQGIKVNCLLLTLAPACKRPRMLCAPLSSLDPPACFITLNTQTQTFAQARIEKEFWLALLSFDF